MEWPFPGETMIENLRKDVETLKSDNTRLQDALALANRIIDQRTEHSRQSEMRITKLENKEVVLVKILSDISVILGGCPIEPGGDIKGFSEETTDEGVHVLTHNVQYTFDKMHSLQKLVEQLKDELRGAKREESRVAYKLEKYKRDRNTLREALSRPQTGTSDIYFSLRRIQSMLESVIGVREVPCGNGEAEEQAYIRTGK